MEDIRKAIDTIRLLTFSENPYLKEEDKQEVEVILGKLHEIYRRASEREAGDKFLQEKLKFHLQ